MPARNYHVSLTQPEPERLARLSLSQRHPARERKRARILLLADVTQRNGGQKYTAIAAVRASALTISERAAVRWAREYLEANLAESVPPERLALVAQISPFHLCRVFHQEAGLPIHAYLWLAVRLLA